ncbi:uncharacterized protein IL334_005673 [Kwoniella shivajii]|uniref:Kinesin motor domain-containing protein n=1 Tax=Kwoniella shivajii TaxID=564305 RepID=A0ABZ1D3S7_9TREE|nr:hypothetical protein IL334_005673 [Kwoniella shivajii]
MSRKPSATATSTITRGGGMSRTASSASIAMPPPSRIPNRPPSTASHREDGSSESRAGSPSKRNRKPSGQSIKGKDQGGGTGESGEINIQVIVRCRGRSQQEVAAASPVITSTSGAISKAITIETTPLTSSSLASFTTASSYGGSHQPSTKTYPFDKVFGPEADQTMIFNEVAEGMLDEVLAGYNCTIFAYGQTGTGKTYTMQGDLELSPLGAPKSTAGIVPRVLHRLFSLLESAKNTEFSVKCSYVELYNEELRDLLATEYKGESSSQQTGLKLYEDGKKGVNIQGLEEAGARSLKEALTILDKGVKRRQTAETKMNTESSRSHTIFSITVHVKETSMRGGGEDLLRIGKFNLVDLAGSEAIGRSGATEKRAREAGMINQSLLTLGRVISALVEKGSHIPYRESKLTRLLQDSLGGRTKTCIVATVSPTRSNLEETLSTLDYAIRAKSIRNRPEVNAHLTKTGLLKEYVGDIERLKNELLAAREKNGIYIPEEQWREMQESQSRQKSDYEEAKLKAGVIEVELETIKKEFDQVTSRFLATSEELSQVREAERQLTDLLEETKVDLEKVRAELEEEAIVSKAYQKGEERLDNLASGLKKTAQESVSDVGGLFDKLARKAKVLGTNADSATRFGGELQGLSDDLRNGLAQLQSVHDGLGEEVQGKMKNYAMKGQEISQSDLQSLEKSFSAFSDLAKRLSASNEKGQKEASESSKAILALKAEVQSSVQEWAEGVSERSRSMVDELLEHQQEHLDTVSTVLGSTVNLVDAVLTTTLSHLEFESSSAIRSRDIALQASSSEISRLQSQNILLINLLADEKAKSAKLRTELVGNVTRMIEGFTQQQDESWTNAIGIVTNENQLAVGQMQVFSEEVTRSHVDGERKRKDIEDEMNIGKSTSEKQRHLGEEALGNVKQGLRMRLEEYGVETTSKAESQVKVIDGYCNKLNKTASDVSGKAMSRGKKQSDLLSAISNNVSQTHQSSKIRLNRLSDEIEDLSSTLLASSSTASASFTQSHQSASDKLQQIIISTSQFLERGIQEDISTGITPRKKVYNVPNSWERTGTREAVLAHWRKRQLQNGANGNSDQTDEQDDYRVTNSAQSEEGIVVINDEQTEEAGHNEEGNDEDFSSRESTSSLNVQIPLPQLTRSISSSSKEISVPSSNNQYIQQQPAKSLSSSQSQSLRQPSNSGLPIKAGKTMNAHQSYNNKKLSGNGVNPLMDERPTMTVLGEGVGVNVPRRTGRR